MLRSIMLALIAVLFVTGNALRFCSSDSTCSDIGAGSTGGFCKCLTYEREFSRPSTTCQDPLVLYLGLYKSQFCVHGCDDEGGETCGITLPLRVCSIVGAQARLNASKACEESSEIRPPKAQRCDTETQCSKTLGCECHSIAKSCFHRKQFESSISKCPRCTTKSNSDSGDTILGCPSFSDTCVPKLMVCGSCYRTAFQNSLGSCITNSVTTTPAPNTNKSTGVKESASASVTPSPGRNSETNATQAQSEQGVAGLQNQSRAVCLHGSLQVRHRNGTHTRVDSLEVGDDVEVGDGKYSTVYLFSHSARERSVFINLTTTSGHWIAVTPGHMVYTCEYGLIQAEKIPLGAHLLTPNRLSCDWSQRIVKISHFVDVGVYNPHTLQGDIVVNQILVSTYTDYIQHRVAHSALSLLRFFWRGLRYSCSSNLLNLQNQLQIK